MSDIVDAISIKLDFVFGEDTNIYLEAIEQDLQTPCFFIQPIDDTDKNMIAHRKYRTELFVIDFIPDDTRGHREQFLEVRDKLRDNFDTLTIGDVVLPTFNRSIQADSDMLHFSFACKYYPYMDKEAEPEMEELEMSVNYNG